jgi:16S rRNA (cytosine1402-N4)-methyltransferase
MFEPRHEPVLLAEVVELLAPWRGGRFLDCTVGLGGHAEAILEAGTLAGVELVGVDRDPMAIELARKRLSKFTGRVELVCGNFREISNLVGSWAPFAGILADFGVSSLQLDVAERGFSFREEGPLDMRMDPRSMPAAELVAKASEEELRNIFRDYGEEPEARRIARAIVAARKKKPLSTTRQLREVVCRAKRERRRGVDPATRVFQALRIAVNDELRAIDRLLDQAIELLAPDGRLVLISFHSLEDRRVKERLRELASGRRDPVTHQVESGSRRLELLTRRALRPSEEEVERNPRARSARLRAARRI